MRSGGDYRAEHAQWLARQVPGLVVLTDMEVPGVPTKPLRQGWPGWWAKIELFSPEHEGDVLFFDLDTVVLCDPDRLEVGRTTMLADFYHPQRRGSGLMYVRQEDKASVWQAFCKSPTAHMRTYRTRDRWGDQAFISEHIGPCATWQELLPGLIQSYKRDLAGRQKLPHGVVCFHGNPRPWQVAVPWVPKLQKTAPAVA